MKILWISEFPPDKGGIGDYSFHLVNGLAERGFDIDVVSVSGERPEDLNEDVDVVSSIPSSRSGWKSVFSDEYDLINVQFPGVRALGLTKYSLLNDIPSETLMTVHEVPTRKRFLPMLDLFDNFAFLSDFGENEFKSSQGLFCKFRGPEFFRLPYQGVDKDIEDRLDSKNFKLEINEDKISIVCPGFIARRKNYDRVVEALPDVLEDHGVELIFAGGSHRNSSGDYEEEIREKIGELGLEADVKITGVLDEEDMVYEYIKSADLCVLPYEEIYQSGVLAKALALGTPTVVSGIEGMRKPVERYGGLVLDDLDPSSIAEKIVEALNSDIAVDSETVLEDMSWERNVEELENVLMKTV
jgi:glycosyltransferase involved in cell wall biosynthesis